MPDSVYCIDTSALIHLKRLYPMDIFQSVWQELGRLARSGRLIAPHEVFKEIEFKDDELLQWAKRHRRMFRKLDAEQARKVREISETFPSLTDPNKEIPDADPFIIALAVIVVTQESRGRSKGKIQIPDVCDHYGLECIAALELFRRENWKF